ncbi:hypothetical protein JCM10450v2_005253 [Rhodotorula kratochvilovae]
MADAQPAQAVEGAHGSMGQGAQGRPQADEPKESMLKRMGGPSDLKAGVGGLKTPEEIQRIVFEASKGSKYFQDQERRDQDLQVKVSKLKARLAQEELTAAGDEDEKVDAILHDLEEKRDLSRVIALIDADAFYAACHVREDPSLEGTAFGVGGGMLTTASYEARKYGCRSAMPLFIAKKLCPHLVSLTLEPDLYVKASREIMAVLAKYGPIAPASLDEAYVDLTQYCADQGVTPAEAITRLRAEVQATTGLTVSAGVSPNKALSKIAADINKPNGQFVIDPTPEACRAFIKGVRLRKCYGIGRVCETLLNGLGLETVGDIYRDRRKLYLVRNHLGQSGQFRWLLSLFLGMGSNRVVRAKRGDRKTYGVEKTFHPTDDRDKLDDIIRRVAKSLAKDLQRAEFSGRTITLRIKHDNFQAVTRAFTPGKNIWLRDYKDLVRHGLALLHKEMDDRRAALARGEPVKGGSNPALKARLLGLRVGNLRDDREVSRTNKLDGWVRASARKTPEIELSDSDTDVQHDSPDEDAAGEGVEGDDDADPGKRALNQLIQDAAVDPFAGVSAEEERGDEFGGASGSGSGRWMCVDEDDIVQEGRGNAPPHAARPPPAHRTSSSSSSSTAASARSAAALAQPTASTSRVASPVAQQAKRKSPSAEPGAPADAGGETLARKRKAKREKATEEKPPSANEWTCPVCNKVLVGSEAAMSGHVAQHFDDGPAKASKTAKGGGWGSGGFFGAGGGAKGKVKARKKA